PITRVRHYLIKAEDVYAAKKTLPDFLMQSPQFNRFIQFNYDVNLQTVAQTSVNKEVALKSYALKKNAESELDPGYDPTLVLQPMQTTPTQAPPSPPSEQQNFFFS